MEKESLADSLKFHRIKLFEDRVVSMFLHKGGLSDHLGRLRDRAFEEFGERGLRLKYFNGWFPQFPIMLATPNDTLDFDMGIWDLWSNFNRNPLYRAYRSHPFSDAAFRGRGYFGLVFSGGVVGPMIMHNDFPRDRSTEVETRIETTYGRRRTKFVIEPLPLVINGISSDWHEGLHFQHE